MKIFDSVNPLYLVFSNADAYIEENSEDKYLIFLLQTRTKKH